MARKNKKPTYKITEAIVAPGIAAGNYILFGQVVGSAVQTRTTKIIDFDVATGTFETFNAYYQVV